MASSKHHGHHPSLSRHCRVVVEQHRGPYYGQHGLLRLCSCSHRSCHIPAPCFRRGHPPPEIAGTVSVASRMIFPPTFCPSRGDFDRREIWSAFHTQTAPSSRMVPLAGTQHLLCAYFVSLGQYSQMDVFLPYLGLRCLLVQLRNFPPSAVT